jgi:nucleotide-binding universal stress UspA family protein
MYAHILVPIDHSALAQQGLAEAIGLAHALGSKIHLIHVVDLRALIHGAAGYTPPEDLINEWKSMGEVLVAQAVDKVQQAGLKADSVVRCDPALRISDAILAEARACGAGLIVMGTHGRRGLTRLVLGSDAEMVLRESPVPVLLVRSQNPADKAD